MKGVKERSQLLKPISKDPNQTLYKYVLYKNVLYTLGDIICLNSGSDEDYYGVIESLFKSKGMNKMYIRWFYKWKDLSVLPSNKDKHTNELFYSYHFDENPVETIVRLAAVEFIKFTTNSDNIPKQLFIRTIFDSIAKKFYKISKKELESNKENGDLQSCLSRLLFLSSKRPKVSNILTLDKIPRVYEGEESLIDYSCFQTKTISNNNNNKNKNNDDNNNNNNNNNNSTEKIPAKRGRKKSVSIETEPKSLLKKRKFKENSLENALRHSMRHSKEDETDSDSDDSDDQSTRKVLKPVHIEEEEEEEEEVEESESEEDSGSDYDNKTIKKNVQKQNVKNTNQKLVPKTNKKQAQVITPNTHSKLKTKKPVVNNNNKNKISSNSLPPPKPSPQISFPKPTKSHVTTPIKKSVVVSSPSNEKTTQTKKKTSLNSSFTATVSPPLKPIVVSKQSFINKLPPNPSPPKSNSVKNAPTKITQEINSSHLHKTPPPLKPSPPKTSTLSKTSKSSNTPPPLKPSPSKTSPPLKPPLQTSKISPPLKVSPLPKAQPILQKKRALPQSSPSKPIRYATKNIQVEDMNNNLDDFEVEEEEKYNDADYVDLEEEEEEEDAVEEEIEEEEEEEEEEVEDRSEIVSMVEFNSIIEIAFNKFFGNTVHISWTSQDPSTRLISFIIIIIIIIYYHYYLYYSYLKVN